MIFIWRDPRAEEMLRDIAVIMSEGYGLKYADARSRVDDRFVGIRIVGDHGIYQMADEEWARHIMFGRDARSDGDGDPPILPGPSRWRVMLNSCWLWQCFCWYQRWWQSARMLIRAGHFPLMWPRVVWRRLTGRYPYP